MRIARSSAVALAAVLASCGESVRTAPPGSTLTAHANPSFIVAHGGVSVITAIVIENAGTTVADGTVVQFFTTLGRIDEEVKTKGGVARANLVSDSRSGTATVLVMSGGTPKVNPTPTPSATATATATADLGTGTGKGFRSSSGPGSFPLAADGDGTTTDGTSAKVTVTIGSALPKRLILVADPVAMGATRTSYLTANVFDAYGNPVSHIPVIFEITKGTRESLDSGSVQQFTDSNGQAFDVVRSRAPYPTASPKPTVAVKATAIATESAAGAVEITIN